MKAKNKKQPKLIEVIRYYLNYIEGIELFKQKKSKRTIEIYSACFSNLIKYLSEVDDIAIEWHAIDSDWLEEYFNALVKQRKFSYNYAVKNVCLLKRSFKIASKKGLIQYNKLNDFTMSYIKKENILHLDNLEINRLELLAKKGMYYLNSIKSIKRLCDRLAKTLDIVLMLIYTGLSVCDYLKFNFEDHFIYNPDDKNFYIIMKRTKTNGTAIIYADSKIMGILEKYDMEFPKISSTKINEYSKELQKIINCTKKFETRLFRTTCAMYHLNTMMRSPSFGAAWLGHKKVATFEDYYGKVNLSLVSNTLAKESHYLIN